MGSKARVDTKHLFKFRFPSVACMDLIGYFVPLPTRLCRSLVYVLGSKGSKH